MVVDGTTRRRLAREREGCLISSLEYSSREKKTDRIAAMILVCEMEEDEADREDD